MNLKLNGIKPQRRYNDKTATISLQALVPVLCRLVNAAVEFLENGGSWRWLLSSTNYLHLPHYSSSCAAKVPALELEFRKVPQTVVLKVHGSCRAEAMKRSFLEL